VKFEGWISVHITLEDNIGDWKGPKNKEPSPLRDVIDKLKLLLETDEDEIFSVSSADYTLVVSIE
jgi:hypothetical protein